ncbi:MAG: PQQ-binding-like beta-propeller repeat protein [Vicinamibacterales bacterium]
MHSRRRTTIYCRCFARITVVAIASAVLSSAVRTDLLAEGLPNTRRWSVPVTAPPIGAPVVAGSSVVLPLESEVSAHRLSDGERIWKTALTAEHPLTADAERVYVATGDALQALDALTGTPAWSVPAVLTAPPLAHAGWVLAASAGDLLAIRASDGEVMWRKHIGPVEFQPALDGELMIVPVTDGRVVALDLRDGTVRWEEHLGSAPTAPFVIGGRVYVGTEHKTFFTLHASSGREASRRAIGALVRGRAVADDRHIYFAAMDNLLWAVDRADGAIEWRKGLKYRPAGGPMLLGGVVVVPGYELSLPAFNPLNGTPGGDIGFPERLSALPVLATGPDGASYALGITGGLENKWMLTMLSPSAVLEVKLEALTTLPGEVVPVPLPPGR